MHDIHYYYSKFPKPGLYITIKVGDWFYRSWLADCTEEQGETIAVGLQDGLVRASIGMTHERFINNWQAYHKQLVRDRIKELQNECERMKAEIAVEEQKLMTRNVPIFIPLDDFHKED